MKEIHIFGFYDNRLSQEEAEDNRGYIVEQLRFEDGVYDKDGKIISNIVIRDDL